MKLSIVIVSWNVKDFLIDCIGSIFEHPFGSPFEIILVDNASVDGTIDCIRQRFPEVKCIANLNNCGFARANNQGASLSQGEYLFFLNPDTILFQDTLKKLVDFMDRNVDIAMCGPRVLNEDKTIQRSVRNFPRWKAVFSRYTLLKYIGIFKSHSERWRLREFNYQEQADVEQLIGAALLIRKDIFNRLGGFDERFFMYYEEVDLCKRVKTSGLRIVYYPGAELVHLGGKSAKQIPAKTRFMTLQSLMLYLRKHTSPRKVFLLSTLFKLGVLSLQLHELILYTAGYGLSILTHNTNRASKCAVRYKSAKEFLAQYYLCFLRDTEVRP